MFLSVFGFLSIASKTKSTWGLYNHTQTHTHTGLWQVLNMTWFCLIPLCSQSSLAWNALALCSIPALSYKPVLSSIGPSVLKEAFLIFLSIQNSFVKYSLTIMFLSSVCTDREHFVELFGKGLPDPETEDWEQGMSAQ